jgi:hypothetical protein
MLSFHHSGLTPIVRNEPNLAGRLGPGGRNMRNKPNRPAGSGPGVEEHGCDYAKQSQFPVRPDAAWETRADVRSCETKPNLGRMGHLRDGAPGTCLSCETKPIPGGATERVSALWERSYGEYYIRWVSAKQSQFGEARRGSGESIMQNKANLPGGSRGPIVPNKPNCPKRRTEAVSRRRPVGRGQSSGDEGQMRKTKPIWPGQGVVATGERCETNPIRAAMPIRRSAFPGGQSCDIGSMPRFGKQSQFAIFRPSRWTRQPPPYAGHTLANDTRIDCLPGGPMCGKLRSRIRE